MKAMIFSDLITSKNAFVQLLLISIVICGFLAWGTGEVIVGTAGNGNDGAFDVSLLDLRLRRDERMGALPYDVAFDQAPGCLRALREHAHSFRWSRCLRLG